MLRKWIDIKIEDGDINYFEYSNFNNIEKISEGGFGSVYKADWNDGGIKVALKRPLNNLTINESQKEIFLKEIKLIRQVNNHPNINQFLGITKDSVCDDYIMVLRYANQGNLREYLEKHFHSLQIQMALDIACGLKYLHSKQIIHRDMHAKNILVDNGRLMIADFGLSKHLTEIKSNSVVFGMPAYIEPQCFISNDYKRDDRSDIYSLGVLLWEISSGRPPFFGVSEGKIIVDISKGKRETPIKGTPFEYQQLYINCWKETPDQRPNIDEIHRILVQLNDNKQIKVDNSKSNDPTSIVVLTNNDNKNDIKLNDSSLSLTEKEIEEISIEITQAFLKRNNIGWTKSFEFYRVLRKYIEILETIFNYLINKSTIQNREVIIGKFYEKGFGIEQSYEKAFEWYMKASQNNDINGHYEIGACYYQGNGIEKDEKKAIEFYRLAADGGLNRALYKLADHYMLKRKDFKSFNFSKIAAKNGFIPSQFIVADRYNCGFGVQKDRNKALKWYKLFQENDGASDVLSKIELIEEKLKRDKGQSRKRIKIE